MYKLIIFDLDGTILNTLEDLADSTNYALVMNGFSKRTIEEVRTFVGNGIGKLIERAVPAGTDAEVVNKVLADFTEYYGKHCADKTRPYDGILELIKSLLEQKYRIAIVSNKFDMAVKELNDMYFEGLFPVAIGASETVAKKPEPDAVFEAIKQLRTSREYAIYVGDSDVDVMTAKNSGLPFVGVTWGFRDEALLRKMGAKHLIHEPKQLFEFLVQRK